MNVWRSTIVAVLLLFCGQQVQAGVRVGGTRLVYDGGLKESSITVSNPGKINYLIQSWVESQEGDRSKAPFIITPPLFRLDSEQDNILRVVRAGGDLPTDRESLFWLNIKSIPAAEKKANTLQIAVKTRIKLIYRPRGLTGTLSDAAAGLQWQRSGNELVVTNPSAYYVNFFRIKVNGILLEKISLVAPKSSARFQLPAGTQSGEISWEIINDYGGASKPFVGHI
ncbi:molecular chaperone [Kalamiella sp. sgz302252]|uniref:fimbrial biogenesis chaperone n=1 Tax=Pantoea sp. sgz302252 TaxID=3341827 RepID=UPI0036D3A780